jgi:hypothetical protein
MAAMVDPARLILAPGGRDLVESEFAPAVPRASFDPSIRSYGHEFGSFFAPASACSP